MAGIMRVLLGALPFLLPTFFFPSLSFFFSFTIYFSHELARMLSPLSLSRSPSIRPIVACTLDQGRIYFTFLFLSLSLSGSWREHLRAFIRIVQRTKMHGSLYFRTVCKKIGVKFRPDPISKIDYIYIDSFFVYHVHCWRVINVFIFNSTRKDYHRSIRSFVISWPRNLKSINIKKRIGGYLLPKKKLNPFFFSSLFSTSVATLRYVTLRYITSRYIARHRRET